MSAHPRAQNSQTDAKAPSSLSSPPLASSSSSYSSSTLFQRPALPLSYRSTIILAICLRILFYCLGYSSSLRTRVELTGPTTSFLRLQEGFFLHNIGAAPHATGTCSHSPVLLFVLFPLYLLAQTLSEYLRKIAFPDWAKMVTLDGDIVFLLLLTAIDVMIAHALYTLVFFYNTYPVVVPLSIPAFRMVHTPEKPICGPGLSEITEELVQETKLSLASGKNASESKLGKIGRIFGKCRKTDVKIDSTATTSTSSSSTSPSIPSSVASESPSSGFSSTSTSTSCTSTSTSTAPSSSSPTSTSTSTSASISTSTSTAPAQTDALRPPLHLAYSPPALPITVAQFFLLNPLSILSCVALSSATIAWAAMLWAFVFAIQRPPATVQRSPTDAQRPNGPSTSDPLYTTSVPSNTASNYPYTASVVKSPSPATAVLAAFAVVVSPPLIPLLLGLVGTRIFVLREKHISETWQLQHIFCAYQARIQALAKRKLADLNSKKNSFQSGEALDAGERDDAVQRGMDDVKNIEERDDVEDVEMHGQEKGKKAKNVKNLSENPGETENQDHTPGATHQSSEDTGKSDATSDVHGDIPENDDNGSTIFLPRVPPLVLTPCCENKAEIVKVACQQVLYILVAFGLWIYSGILFSGSESVFNSFHAYYAHAEGWPAPGLLWHLFTHLFLQFHPFFAVVFLMLPIYAAIMLTLRLGRWPMFTSAITAMLTIVFRYAPTINDYVVVGCWCLASYALIRHRCRNLTLIFLILAQVCIGAAVAWHVWIFVGSGNANFVFFQTIAISLCIILLVIEMVSSVRRLQSIAPGVMVVIGDVYGEWE